MIEDGKIKFINYMVLSAIIRLIGKARSTEIVFGGYDLGGFADVTFAVVALDFIGWIHDILYGWMGT